MTNLTTGRGVGISDGKGRRGLLPFLRALGAKGRCKLRGVVSDLGYQPMLARRLRHAVHILDRFHIVQWVNQALTRRRRRRFSGAPRDELGRTLKVKKWLLLSARENLAHPNKLGDGRAVRPPLTRNSERNLFLRGADTYGQSFPTYLLQVTALSVAIAWLYWRTQGSLLLTMLMHAAINNTKDIVPSIARTPSNPFAPSASLMAWLGLAVLWMAAGYFLVRMSKAGRTAPALRRTPPLG